MIFTWERLDELKAVRDGLTAMLDYKEFELTAALPGETVPFREDEQVYFMKGGTLLAYLSECNVACYPLSASSVVFLP